MPKSFQQMTEPKTAEKSTDAYDWTTELAMLIRNVNVLVVMFTNKLREEKK